MSTAKCDPKLFEWNQEIIIQDGNILNSVTVIRQINTEWGFSDVFYVNSDELCCKVQLSDHFYSN